MSQALTVFLSAALSSAVVAVVLVMQPEPPPAPGAAEVPAALVARLDEIAARIERLETRSAGDAAAPVRSVAAPLTRQDVERMIAAAVGPSSGDAGASEAAAEEFHIDAAVAELTAGGLDEQATTAVWARAKRAGKVKELIAAFEARAQGNPGSADAQSDLGNAYVQAIIHAEDMLAQSVYGQKADQAYDAALAIDGNHWHARFSKATGLTFWPDFLGKKAEAIRHFEILATQQEATTPRPEFVDTWLVLGNLYQQQGKDDEARKTWERGSRQFPNDPRLRGKLAQ